MPPPNATVRAKLDSAEIIGRNRAISSQSAEIGPNRAPGAADSNFSREPMGQVHRNEPMPPPGPAGSGTDCNFPANRHLVEGTSEPAPRTVLEQAPSPLRYPTRIP